MRAWWRGLTQPAASQRVPLTPVPATAQGPAWVRPGIAQPTAAVPDQPPRGRQRRLRPVLLTRTDVAPATARWVKTNPEEPIELSIFMLIGRRPSKTSWKRPAEPVTLGPTTRPVGRLEPLGSWHQRAPRR